MKVMIFIVVLLLLITMPNCSLFDQQDDQSNRRGTTGGKFIWATSAGGLYNYGKCIAALPDGSCLVT